MNAEIKILVPLTELKDSMLLDSGQEVINLKYKGYEVSVRVCGEVRVQFKGGSYAASSQMPEELLQKFRDGTAYDGTLDEDGEPVVNIINNNWFETFLYKDGKWTGWSTLPSDFENETEEEIASGLKDDVDDYIDCIEKSVDHAMDLLLSHAKDYDLEGVEFTEEDAKSVISLINENNTPEEAVKTVLDGIRECLDNGND